MEEEIAVYVSELEGLSKKAHDIAMNHLGTSFHIARSNGFKEWKQKREKEKAKEKEKEKENLQ